MRFNTTSYSNGVSIVDSTKATVNQEGTYNIQFSAQFDKTDSGKDEVEVWLRVNGVDLDWSSTILEIDGNNAEYVAAWNWLVDLKAGEFVELVWFTADVNMRILSRGALTSPSRPEVPSVILTVSQVG
jgi:hypothetical protein